MLFISCFLFFAIFLHFVFFLLSRFLLSLEIKINFGKNKEHLARNTIINKTVVKRKKARGKKQKTKNTNRISVKVQIYKSVISNKNEVS